MPVSSKQLTEWVRHYQDEADACFLYGVLAEQERDLRRKELYQKLAEVESKHTAVWQKILAEHGHSIATPKPSLKARLQAWVARRFGPGFLLNQLLREEGEEVKGYLALHRTSEAGSAKDAALRLAQESAEHAQTLGVLAKTEGEPWHQAESGGFLRNVVYGFNDGLTANFGLVAGVIGAFDDPNKAHELRNIVLISGVAGILADSLSMGSSGYLAAKSEEEVYQHEIAMEKEELRLMPEVEEEELALIYQAKGIAPDVAKRMAHEVMQEPGRALDEKVREELKIGTSTTSPMREGIITGSATAIGALLPVAPFLWLEGAAAMWTSFGISMAAHFAVGAARSVFTGRGIFRSGFDMFIVGFGIAVVGYFAGELLMQWLGGAVK